MSALTLGDIALVQDDSEPDQSGDFSSLSDIASGIINRVADAAGNRLVDAVNNTTRSSNTLPQPDLAAAAASPKVSTFVSAKFLGVSIPILLIGGGALVYILLKRR